MVFFKAVLAFALVAAVWAQSPSTATVSVSTSGAASTSASATTATTATTTRRPYFFQTALNSMGNSVRAMIGMFNTTAQTGTKMLSDGMLGMTGAAQQMINTASSVGSTGVKGGVDMVKQGIDIGTNMMGVMPVMGRFATVGGNLAKTGADVANMAAQAGIKVGSGIASGKMQLAGDLTHVGTGIGATVASMGANMATKGLDTGISVVNNVVGTIGNVIDKAENYANQASTKLSSLASSTADRMSVHAYSLPSTLSLSGVVDKAPTSTVANGVAVSGAAIPAQGQSNVQVQVVA